MHVKIAAVLFAVATLLQPSHSIPTHRYARDSPDWASRFKEYINKIPGYGGGSSESSKPPSSNQPDSSSSQQGAAVGSETPSASAPEASIVSKDGTSTTPSSSGFGSYMPNMQTYQNMIPSGMSSYYPSQLPQSMNPSGYFGSIPGSSGSAGSASTPEASIASKDGTSTTPSSSGFGSYMPNMQTYQNMIPSGMSSYYPSQLPQSMNPSGYLGSIPGSSGSAGSASTPEASIASKDGTSTTPSSSGFGSYMPNMQTYQNMIPSGMSSYYPSQLPQSMNPSGYLGSIPGSSGSAGSASTPEASIASKDGTSTTPSSSGFGSYMPNMQTYQNMIPSGMSSYYPSQLPQSMNPSGYLGSIPGSSGSAGSASTPEASIASKDGTSTTPSSSGFGSYMPNMQTYQNMIPSGMSSYYPSQLPQSMNPSGYLGSIPGSSGSAGSASTPEASIASKDGTSTTPSSSGFGSYMPNMQTYQNMIPSGMSNYYPSQMPQSMNPSSYLGSKPTGS